MNELWLCFPRKYRSNKCYIFLGEFVATVLGYFEVLLELFLPLPSDAWLIVMRGRSPFPVMPPLRTQRLSPSEDEPWDSMDIGDGRRLNLKKINLNFFYTHSSSLSSLFSNFLSTKLKKIYNFRFACCEPVHILIFVNIFLKSRN